MRIIPIALAALFVSASAWAASPEVSVIGSYPGLSGELGRDEPLYLRLSYKSDTPIRVQASGYFDGIEVRKDVRWNPSPAYPAGEGEALVWIAYAGATHLDTIHIEVADANWHPLIVAKLPVAVAWSSEKKAPRQAAPEWVARLSAPQQKSVAAAAAAASESDSLFTELLLGPLLAVGFPGYFVLQGLFAWRFSGGWWIAALLPLLVAVPALVHAGIALSMGSNIWPIFIVLTAPFLFLYLCALGIARFLVRGVFA